MGAVEDFLFQQITPLWHRKPIGIGISLIVGFGIGFSAGRIPGLAAGLFVCVLWLYLHYIPHIDKGKVGILVAITADQEDESRQVEADFIASLRELLQQNSRKNGFQILILPKFASISINEDVAQANFFIEKTRAHFMLFGRARKRLIDSKVVHLLNLECIVTHSALPEAVQQHFLADISQALPRRIKLPDDNAVLAFEVASQLADLGARYTIGLAALVSRDLVYAEELFLDVESRLRRCKVQTPGVQHIARSVPELMRTLYENWMVIVTDAWILGRQKHHVEMLDVVSTKLLARDGTDYNALLSKAITHFWIRRDLKSAYDILEKCRTNKDAAWLYSFAFLYGYEGRLEEANDCYRSAFKMNLSNVTVPIQCEEFIQNVLDAEPDKQQLHFCLAVLNYDMKKDYEAADRDFSRFIEWPGSAAYPNQRELCIKLKKRCHERRG